MSENTLQDLIERARVLAIPENASVSGEPLMLCVRQGQTYGFKIPDVESAGRLKKLSLVPGAPPWLFGAIHHRGAVISLIDLAAFWGQSDRGVADLPTYVVISHGSSRVGILIEELLGVVEVGASPTTYSGTERSGVVAVTQSEGRSVLLLSAEQLFKDDRLR